MITSDLHTALQPLLSRFGSDRIVVVADECLRTLYPSLLAPVLADRSVLWLTADEGAKSLQTVQRIWDFLFEQQLTRRGCLLCIGGGVVTDLGGFAAATYKRGIRYVNIPTTLLAMVDASTGGKTGFNYRGFKNAIGAFCPPEETLICPQWLTALPAHQLLSGFAEMLKTGLVSDADLWHRLLQYDLDGLDVEPLTPLIAGCIAAKERIVAADPHESGLRKVLNFGHTFGHALEEIWMLNADRPDAEWPHGYAVLYGLIAELYLSVTRLGMDRLPLQQLTSVMLRYYGRPHCRCSDFERLVELMRQDKKNERAAQINCTLLSAVGQPVINQVISDRQALEAWDYLFSL